MSIWSALLSSQTKYTKDFQRLFSSYVVKKESVGESLKVDQTVFMGSELVHSVVLTYKNSDNYPEYTAYLLLASNNCEYIDIRSDYDEKHVGDYIVLTPFVCKQNIKLKFNDKTVVCVTKISFYVEVIDWIVECINVVDNDDKKTKSALFDWYCYISEYIRWDRNVDDLMPNIERQENYLKKLKECVASSNDLPELKSISGDNKKLKGDLRPTIINIAKNTIKELSKKEWEKLNQADLTVFYCIFKYLGVDITIDCFCEDMENITFHTNEKDVGFKKESIVKKLDNEYFKEKKVKEWSDSDFKSIKGNIKTIKTMITLRDNFFKEFQKDETAKEYLNML